MFKSIGPVEWVVIGFILVFLVTSKRIPEFFKSVSDALLEFKKAAKDTKPEEKK